MFKKIFISEIKSILGPPRQNYKTLLFNLLGLQVVRYLIALIKYELFKINNLKTSQAIGLNNDGYVLVKDFLSENEFELISNLCSKIEQEKKYQVKYYGETKVHSFDFFDENNFPKDEIHKIKTIFFENLLKQNFIDEIFNILKINKDKSFRNLSYEKVIAEENFIDKGDENSEFHADRFYPCVKIFFYLNDNSIQNGAFEYIAKSHKFSFERLKHEYFYSIFIGAKKIFKQFIEISGYEIKNNRVTFKKNKIVKDFGEHSIVACEAPKNTLIICNNKGFHKRGKLEGGRERAHLRLNLYDLQTSNLKYKLFKFAKKFKSSHL